MIAVLMLLLPAFLLLGIYTGWAASEREAFAEMCDVNRAAHVLRDAEDMDGPQLRRAVTRALQLLQGTVG